MRTALVIAGSMAAAASAVAHEGHGPTDFHWHGGDLLSVGAMVLAVALWLWQRSKR